MKILGLIASLAFLVITHEFGHYIFARIFKTRVERFYIFFNWGFSLMRMKKIEGKYRFSFFSKEAPEEWKEYPDSTEWGIGWLPLGGYCSIAGMIDETQSAEDMASEPQPWEFRSKPAWQRFFIIIGGVFMNFLSAIIIYAAMLGTWGKEYIPINDCKYGLHFSETGRNLGFQSGDKIVMVDGDSAVDMSSFLRKVYFKGPFDVVVKRGEQFVTIQIPEKFAKRNFKQISEMPFCSYNFPFVVDSILQDFPAAEAGLMEGDSIVMINSEYNSYFPSIQEYMYYNGGKEVALSFYREDSLITQDVKINNEGKIGVLPVYYTQYLDTKKEKFGFFSSISNGFKMAIDQLKFYVEQFSVVFTKEGAKQLGGFGTMGKLFPNTWDWYQFWNTTALFAIILAFMNIVPIPGLDGGYLMFILYEMITRKKPGDKFITYANAVGMILILALVLYANGMDVIRAFR